MKLRTLSSLGNLPHRAQRIVLLLFRKNLLLETAKCRLHPDETIQHIVCFEYHSDFLRSKTRIMRGTCTDCKNVYEFTTLVNTVIFDLEV